MSSSSLSRPRSQYAAPSAESSTHVQMPDEEDAQHSPMWDASSLTPEHHISSSLADHSLAAQYSIKSELTESPDFRISRLSTVLPRPPLHPTTSPEVAIPAQNYTRNINSFEDVPSFVNSSASYLSSSATRTDAFSHYLGPSVSSSTHSHHVLTHRRQRPRTSNQVFTSSHGSVAPHGLPQSLPPAPSTAPRRTTQSEPIQPTLPDFSSMASNYLNMLAQKPTDNTMAADSTTTNTTVSPADLQQQAFGPEDLQSIVDVIKGGYILNVDPRVHLAEPHPASTTMPPPPTPETPELWSSPAYTTFGDEFPDYSPFSPDIDALNTPVVGNEGDDMMSGMVLFDDEYHGGDLFPPMDYTEFNFEKPAAAPQLPENLYTFSPASPALHDFNPSINPSSIYPSPRLPSDLSSFPSPAPATPSTLPCTLDSLPNHNTAKAVESDVIPRRRSSATGTRKGVTPAALVPINAPTQPRKYLIPSKTSRKEVPSVFAKKRSRSTAFDEEEDEFNEPPLPPDATEKEQIEYKRRQNTVAARRSRKRKLQYQQDLEEKVERLQRERDVWKTRAVMCQEMLVANGVQFTPFQDSTED
ncbi:hypothetical protein D9615_006763 [Tricholomella constricta]|uniref:BZIP domain-containing protein n=1 Tax=Tricholomella constricta TaxID=117010 RepID=A0A8H5M1K0_9AGAR|nr:hypothetical protein D9615_006763 [Tricholomella constricta]